MRLRDRLWIVALFLAVTALGTNAAGSRTLLENALYCATATGGVCRAAKSKLADVVSVKDFGAKGDGIADDSTAVANALAAAGSNQLVGFDCPGNFKTTAYGTLACGDYYPPLPDSGAIPRSLAVRVQDSVSVKDYGAKGDGVTDDTTAIQSAVASGRDVFFPIGSYLTTGNHGMSAGQLIFGGGYNSRIIVKAGSGANDVFKYSGTLDLANVEISHLRITCNSQTTGAGIGFYSSSYLLVNDVYVTGCGMGMHLNTYQHAQVINSRFDTNNTYGIRIERNQATQAGVNSWFQITDSNVNSNISGGIYASDSADIHVTNTVVSDNHDFGVMLDQTAPVIGVYLSTNSVIINADIDGNWNKGVALYNQKFATVASTWFSSGRTSTGTTANANGQCIYIEDSKYIKVTGNHVFDCGGHGLQIASNTSSSSDIDVIGGSYNGNSGSGVYVAAGASVTAVKVIGVTTLGAGVMAWTQTNGVEIDAGSGHSYMGGSSSGNSGNQYSIAGTLSYVGGATDNSVNFLGAASNTSTAKVFRFGNQTSLATSGANLVELFSDNMTTRVAFVNRLGSYITTTGKVTAGQITGTPTNAGSVTPDFGTGNTAFYTANAAVASFTVNNPTNVSAGWHGIFVKNNSGGALTTSWGAAYHLAGAWVDGATGKGRGVWFICDGSPVCYEVSRSVADVTN